MLIEINLLPEKEKKSKTLFYLSILFVVLLIVGGIFAYVLNQSLNSKIANLEQQIKMTEQLVALKQEEIDNYNDDNSIEQLANTVLWAKSYPIKTVPVLQKLTALLPERGFIQSFSYEELGTVYLTVQFETTREAAYYLNSLLQSEWFVDAKLHNLFAETEFYDRIIGEEEEENDNNKLTNEKYIPRYVGDYEILLNRDFIKAESSEQEGGNNE